MYTTKSILLQIYNYQKLKIGIESNLDLDERTSIGPIHISRIITKYCRQLSLKHLKRELKNGVICPIPRKNEK